MKNKLVKSTRTLRWLTLFTSTGTLICCALPIILITLGLGASVAALANALPFLVFLSLHKIWIFVFSGLMLMLTGWLAYRPNKTCPTDPELNALCQWSQAWNLRIFWISMSIWSIGFFAAFLALPLRILLEG